MAEFDYVVVGAGPAGCVLANRLSADPGVSVLLVEAGDWDTNPLIAMPMGFAGLLGDPATVWLYPTRPFGPSRRVEYWVRGKTLGGSSSVNGITSSDPDAPPDIDANYLATEHDRTKAVGVFRGMRRLFTTSPLAERIKHETVPGEDVRTDQEIIDAALTNGGCGYHTVGTCAMGPDDEAVVDPRLRVRGVTNLRVVDASVLPTMVSGNLNGPVTALAWRAADLILDNA